MNEKAITGDEKSCYSFFVPRKFVFKKSYKKFVDFWWKYGII